jgi:hypothetical protein
MGEDPLLVDVHQNEAEIKGKRKTSEQLCNQLVG